MRPEPQLYIRAQQFLEHGVGEQSLGVPLVILPGRAAAQPVEDTGAAAG